MLLSFLRLFVTGLNFLYVFTSTMRLQDSYAISRFFMLVMFFNVCRKSFINMCKSCTITLFFHYTQRFENFEYQSCLGYVVRKQYLEHQVNKLSV